jgi:ACS family tartrate transporter-like MFS transporter
VAGAASGTTVPSSPAIADRTRHHIALRILPFLFILYITNYLDRTSVAFAAIGMARDLGFNDRVFGLGSGIFFVSYLALQIPGALLVERWSARRLISSTMIVWGSLTVLTALVHTPAQLYLARFVLGAAEAGFFPGVIVYLSHWFIQEDRAKATSNFMAAIPLSMVIGSPVGGWILGHAWFNVNGWRWLFVLEGVPAIVLGMVAFFFLTDWPKDAEWLSPEQRLWIEHRLKEEQVTHVQPETAWRALCSPIVLLLASAAFLEYFMGYTFYFWLPTLLKRTLALSDIRVGLLASLPYVAGFLAMLVNGWHSDRRGERRWHSAVPLFMVAVAWLGLSVAGGSSSVLVFLFTMVGLQAAFFPVFWAIPTENLSKSTAAAAVGMINAVGSVAGFAGPYAFSYLSTRTGSFTAGFTVLACCCLWAGILLLLLPITTRPRTSDLSYCEEI